MIARIQAQLERLYGILLPQRVEEYLVNRKEALEVLSLPTGSKIPKELFLVRQNGGDARSGDTLEIALFFDSRLLDNLEKNNPFFSLNDKNLSDFCILIEGVSHFVYYLWKAHQGHPITQLEMELQAEIDKFLMLLFYLRADGDPALPQKLFDALFDRFTLLESLSEEKKARYLTASRLAMQYCHRLQAQFFRRREFEDLIGEIRRFYNYSQEQKISHIIH